jgi:PTS system nitrogen regulatory IIA component
MRILDFLHKETVIPDLQARDKKGVLEELTLPVAQITKADHKELVRVLIEREHLGSTGIGGGIGIPHGKLKTLSELVLGVGLSRKGINFDAIDKKPTHIFFLLLTPDDSAGIHLQLLAQISKLLKDEEFKNRLLEAKDREDLIRVIREVDEEF